MVNIIPAEVRAGSDEIRPRCGGIEFENSQVRKHSWRFALLVALLLFETGLCETGFLVIYADPEASIEDASGQSVGTTGKPFNPQLPSSDNEEMVFFLRAEGYEAREIRLPAGELRNAKRLPDRGSYQLVRTSQWPFLWLAVPVVIVIGWVSARQRKRPPPILAQGEQDFELGELLGKGATSRIYEGTATGIDGPVAVKILEVLESDEMASRFLRSLQSTLVLEHPSLVKIHRAGATSKNQPYLIMEKLEGRDLLAELKSRPRLEDSTILEILTPICRVLHYLHQNDIVHRDVKPANIYLCDSGEVKLMDLEISRSTDAEDLTATGVAVGTPFYIAPEQAQGQPGPQSDQYAVGIIFFQMLSGQPPFKGASAVEVIGMHLKEPIPYLDEATDLQNAVIQKMTSKRPESRFADMLEVLEALEDALGESDQEQTGTVY